MLWKQIVPNTTIMYSKILCILILISCTINIAAQSNKESVKVNCELSGSFNQLSINGDVTVYLLQGDEQSVLIHGKKSMVKQVKTSIDNKVLYISKDYSINSERINIYITVTDIESIQTRGNVIIETPTNIWLSKLSLSLGDDTDVKLFVNSNDFNIDVKGSGNLELSGYIDTLRITSSGESEIFGDIKTVKLSCNTTGYSSVTLEGIIFKSYISSNNESSVDLNNCEVGMSSIFAFDQATVKTTSIDVTDIYAFDQAVIHYKSNNQAFVLTKSNKNSIKKDLIRSTASK